MGARLRGLAVVLVVLLVGAFLGSTLSQWGSGGARTGSAAPPPDARAEAPVGRRVRVEVLNGGGLEDMARAATDRLRDRGFDVVYYGNAASFDHDTSVVLDRVGEPGLARRVAEALGVATVRSEPDPNLYLEVSVVLGADWVPPPTARPVADDELDAEAPWWDLRRFFRNDGKDGNDDGSRPAPPGSRDRMVDPGEEGN